MASDNKKKTPYIYIDIDSSDQPPIVARRRSQYPQQKASVSGQPGVVMLGDAADEADDDEAQAIMPLVVPIFRNAIDPDFDAISSSVPEPSVNMPPRFRGMPRRQAQSPKVPLDERSSVEAYLQKQAGTDRGDARKRGLHESGAPGRPNVPKASSAGTGAAAAAAYGAAGYDVSGAGAGAAANAGAANSAPVGSQDYDSPYSAASQRFGAQNPAWDATSHEGASSSQQMAIQPYNAAYAQWYQQAGYAMPYPSGYAGGWGARGAAGEQGFGYPYAAPQGYGYASGDPYGMQGAVAPDYAAAYGAPEGGYPGQSGPTQAPGGMPGAYGASMPSMGSSYPGQGASDAYDYARAGYPGAYGSYGQHAASPYGSARGAASYPSAGAAASYVAPEYAASEPASEGDDEIGQPLLDERAIAESSIFDEPSVSLEEGMRDLEGARRKRKRLIIIMLIVLAVVAVALVVLLGFVFNGDADKGSADTQQAQTQSSSSSASSSSSSKRSQAVQNFYNSSSSSSSSAASGNQSGYMSFQYTGTTTSGVSYTCMETVTFKSDGDCEFTTMDMEFPNAEAASAFVEALANDYGSNFTLDSQNGAEAKVTINNSGLHLNRKEYEQALRASVEDVVILEKK